MNDKFYAHHIHTHYLPKIAFHKFVKNATEVTKQNGLIAKMTYFFIYRREDDYLPGNPLQISTC